MKAEISTTWGKEGSQSELGRFIEEGMVCVCMEGGHHGARWERRWVWTKGNNTFIWKCCNEVCFFVCYYKKKKKTYFVVVKNNEEIGSYFVFSVCIFHVIGFSDGEMCWKSILDFTWIHCPAWNHPCSVSYCRFSFIRGLDVLFFVSLQVHYNKYYSMRNKTLCREIFTNSWGEML